MALAGFCGVVESEGFGFQQDAVIVDKDRTSDEGQLAVTFLLEVADGVEGILANKDGKRGRGTLAAAIPGTKSDEIISILVNAMGKSVRRRVKEVTCDLSPSMMLIAAEVFCNAHVVNDRFHVQQVYNEAVDEIRIDIRRRLVAEKNERDKSGTSRKDGARIYGKSVKFAV